MSITITNLTPTRAFDANDVSPNVLADALGTLVDDVEAGTYDGSAWTITNGTTLRLIDALNGSYSNLADVIATFVADNPGPATVWNFLVENYTADNAMDANNASLFEMINVLATLRSERVNPIGPPRFEYMAAFTPGFEMAEAQ